MDWVEEIIGELPEIDLGGYTFANISGSVWIMVLALLFTIIMIIIGYRNGIITELGGLVAIVGSVLILRTFSPTLQSNLGELTGLKRFVVYALVALVVYIVIKKIMLYLGKAVRHVPVVGFISGVFGAAAGFLKAVLVLILVQMTTDIDILGTAVAGFERLPF